MPRAAAGLFLLSTAGCAILGPECSARRQAGAVTTIQGEVAAGQIVSHRVAYDTRGSQNDVAVSWPGSSSPDSPALAIYATKAACSSFTLPASQNTGDCAPLGIAGRVNGIFASSLNITHGRGNPEQLGNPPEYILWVVGDPLRASSYALGVTWVFPVDC